MGTQDWFSPNPRLNTSPGGLSPSDLSSRAQYPNANSVASPHRNQDNGMDYDSTGTHHGIFDRYDLVVPSSSSSYSNSPSHSYLHSQLHNSHSLSHSHSLSFSPSSSSSYTPYHSSASEIHPFSSPPPSNSAPSSSPPLSHSGLDWE
ncbi:hypothetical protein BT96DRAFT_1009136 [Gymnopus androsaceus JB14]|uniref:Uncharacterized protein n=1 Tax=Gymnopus androsaceus JB14 TaxID=1447944 RepID=A0A6A4GD56_9AGAR|nr:hypothetical protein BT96DRAFT_1009136 [Gymnopus androsaceus JB14]